MKNGLLQILQCLRFVMLLMWGGLFSEDLKSNTAGGDITAPAMGSPLSNPRVYRTIFPFMILKNHSISSTRTVVEVDCIL